MWLRKRNLRREPESLLIATQNNAIRTTYIKTKTDKTQQNSECRVCGERDEMKIHWEFSNKFEYDYANK